MSTRRQYIQLYHGWAIRTQGALTLLRIFMKVKYMNRTLESGTTDIASRNCSFYTGFNSVSSQLMAQEESTQLKCTDGQMDMRMLSRFRRIRPFATPWAVARQAPLSTGFSRNECWSGLPCLPPGESSRPRDQTHLSYTSCIAGRS